jgi:hypothetical protein
MISLIRLDEVVGDMASAAAVASANRLVARALRAVATGIMYLADFLEPPKKEKGIMLSGAE